MLQVERFVNELMSSNCYIVWDDASLRCLVIDPASEKSLREIEFIESHNLTLDYILLTHEHTDHTWGVNALLDKYDAKVICSQKCKENLPKSGDMYFQLYYDRKDYHYEVRRVDFTCEEQNWELGWNGKTIKFINTPGHSFGSMCIRLNNMLFSGDTIMQSKPFINKRNGSLELYKKSIYNILSLIPENLEVYPGHGDKFPLSVFGNKYTSCETETRK